MNNQTEKPKILVILGPTATGKTDLGLELAEKFKGELISCDSRQVYKELDLTSGKMPGKDSYFIKQDGAWIIDNIPVYMYDVAAINQVFTAFDYVTSAKPIIQRIVNSNKLPIIVGGTGLYLKALLEGLGDMNVPKNLELRQKLEELNLPEIQKMAEKKIPGKWVSLNNSDRNNKRRLIRYLEINHMYPYKNTDMDTQGLASHYHILKIGLDAPRPILYKGIDDRVISRINLGMVEEIEKLVGVGVDPGRLRELGLECRVIIDFLSGKISGKEEMIKTLQFKIHAFARRQQTWFKKEQGVNWFDITEPNFKNQVVKQVSEWYYLANV